MRKWNVVILSLVMIVSASACSQKKLASNITAKIFVDGSPAMEAQEDIALAEQSLVPMLQMLEVFQYANPKNRHYNFLLAKAYGNYAYAYFEEQMLKNEANKDGAEYQTAYRRADLFYRKARDYGLLAFNQNDAVKKALTGTLDDFKKVLAKEYDSKKDVPLLYWTAFSWANWVNLHKDSPAAVGAMGKIEAMMARALELDPTYFYGGIHQFYGAYYASRPAMLGGNLEKSTQHFQKAIEITQERFLLAKVVYAQYYAVAAQDRPLFERLLKEVIAADPAILPEERLANEVAIVRAKTLLAHASNYF